MIIERLNDLLYFNYVFLEPVSGALNFTLANVDGKPITFGKILVGILFLAAGLYISKILIRLISHKILIRVVESRAAAHAIENIAFYVLVTFFSLVSLQVANIPITVFNIIGGAIALAAGLGSQNIMNNFISGVIILIERPVKIGDIVLVDGVYGRIEDIGMRATKINSFENKHLIVPNSRLLESKVDNWTHNGRKVKSELKVGVRYGSDPEVVKTCIQEAALSCSQVLKSKKPLVIFENFGESSLEFTLIYELKVMDLLDERKANSFIREQIAENFKLSDITIAYPQRDVHIHLDKSAQKALQKAS